MKLTVDSDNVWKIATVLSHLTALQRMVEKNAVLRLTTNDAVFVLYPEDKDAVIKVLAKRVLADLDTYCNYAGDLENSPEAETINFFRALTTDAA